MGNVPARLEEDYSGYGGRGYGRPKSHSLSSSGGRIPDLRQGKRRTTSIVNGVLEGNRNAEWKSRSTLEKDRLKEEQAKELVVRYTEMVDGGFLAPYGCYELDKIDYDTAVVKNLIKKRKLAPFYTPLQDYSDDWSEEELIKIVDGLPLHASFLEKLEKYEDVPIGDLNESNFDYLIDSKNLSRREQKKRRAKIFSARLYKKRIKWQEYANEIFLEKKYAKKKLQEAGVDFESSEGAKIKTDEHLPSDDLKLSLYRHGDECPICFLYYPVNLNTSVCCQQPICSECFVQIKRMPPHFPHDDKEGDDDTKKDPQLLISEPAKCPYCGIPNFAVTYQPLKSRKVGYKSVMPSLYRSKLDNDQAAQGKTEELDSSLTATSDTSSSGQSNKNESITSDTIRPNWKEKLNKERSRLDRRAANATAIHVSNRLIPEQISNNRNNANLSELEDQMMEQAIKLSLNGK